RHHFPAFFSPSCAEEQQRRFAYQNVTARSAIIGRIVRLWLSDDLYLPPESRGFGGEFHKLP
ncbi:hypothetical protein, partial [Mesorhizobium humile]|uniref:hypothetical protein n=1 Tax=Mesorhizobium humile TaxID=3072313 RepID=UPI002A240451